MIYQSPIFDQRINNAFNVKSPEMVGHTLKSLQHLLQDFQSVSDHFETLYIKKYHCFSGSKYSCMNTIPVQKLNTDMK